MKSDEAYTGFEIELWEEISKDLGLDLAYYETNMDTIFKDLIEGKAQVGFFCITITHEREKLVDFSHHTLDSGLRILVSIKKGFSLIEPVKSLFSPLVLKLHKFRYCKKIERRTLNIQHRTSNKESFREINFKKDRIHYSMFDVGRSMFDVH